MIEIKEQIRIYLKNLVNAQLDTVWLVYIYIYIYIYEYIVAAIESDDKIIKISLLIKIVYNRNTYKEKIKWRKLST